MNRTTPHPNNETTRTSACSRLNFDARGLTRIKGFLGSPS